LPKPTDDSDLLMLQGSWEQVALEVDGVSNPPDMHSAPGALTTFNGNHFAVRTSAGLLLLEGTFELDPTSNPKAVTWIDTMGDDLGKRFPAIYELEGDHFVFVAADAEAPRPSVFRTGSGQTMRTFVRRSRATTPSP
jgi:uncharacterized protein (TIGR03067 family)